MRKSEMDRKPRKRTVQECRRLDINLLARKGVFRDGDRWAMSWKNGFMIELQATVKEATGVLHLSHPSCFSQGSASDKLLTVIRKLFAGAGIGVSPDGVYHYDVGLIATRPAIGGLRWWFLCWDCGRRVAKLYQVNQVRPFTCRQCGELTYASCQKSHCPDPHDKIRRWADRILKSKEFQNA
jgi:hypothetical protein